MSGLAVEEIARSVASPDPTVRLSVLEHLQWGEGSSEVEWRTGTTRIGKCYLGSFPTMASIAVPSAFTDEGPWWTAYLSGFRWCLSVDQGYLRWRDLHEKRAWECRAGDLSSDAIIGLTPQSFAERGRFEPTSGLGQSSDDIPTSDPTQYFLDTISRWFREYMVSSVVDGAEVAAQREFTVLISALILLRTIEDLEAVDWIRKGTLSAAADDPTGRRLRSLFDRSAERLNSRIFQRLRQTDFRASKLCSLVHSVADLHYDFSALDVDPVAGFYEQFLATAYSLESTPQRDLFTRNRKVRSDSSVRRKQGAYYTPPMYADLLAKRIVLPDARLARTASELPIIVDLAAGSGELLCAALRQVLSCARWRKPEIIHDFLNQRLYAVDINNEALHLAALNVLRTAIRYVPDLLKQGRKLPALESNFLHGDSLSSNLLARVPKADIVLLNPPFRGALGWGAPQDALPELIEIGNRANLAMAFMVAATARLREGGALGAVLQSQLIAGSQSRQARRWIGERVNLEMVIENFAKPFRGVQSYAGLVIGHRICGDWRPDTQLIQVPGNIEGDVDLGALLANDEKHRGVENSFVSADVSDFSKWTKPLPRVSVKPGWVSFNELAGGSVHQGIVPAPEVSGRNLFLFRELPHSGAEHILSGRVFRSATGLRPVSYPNGLGRVPLFGRPHVPGMLTFQTPRRDGVPILVSDLAISDPSAAEFAREVIRVARGQRWWLAPSTGSELRFKALIEEGRLDYLNPKGFIDGPKPLLVFARATRLSERGHTIQAWIDEDGRTIPFSGFQVRASDLKTALALALLLNTPIALEGLIQHGAPRNVGTVEPRVSGFAAWQVPDINSATRADIMDHAMAAFAELRRLRESGNGNGPNGDRALKSLLSLGERLWRG